MKRNKFPKDGTRNEVRRVLAHYEEQSEDEAVAEDEAAFEDRTQTLMEVPKELVPAIRELVAKQRARPAGRTSRSRRRPRTGRA
jgi:hypothetical protein